MTIYIAQFPNPNPEEPPPADLMLDANDEDHAMKVLEAHGVKETPFRFIQLIPGTFLGEVWVHDDEDKDNPANLASSGVVVELYEAAAAVVASLAHEEEPPPEERETSPAPVEDRIHDPEQ